MIESYLCKRPMCGCPHRQAEDLVHSGVVCPACAEPFVLTEQLIVEPNPSRQFGISFILIVVLLCGIAASIMIPLFFRAMFGGH